MRRRPPLVVAAALLLLPMVGAACGGDTESGDTAAAGHVNVVDNKFKPEDIDVSVGDTVTWDFKGSTNHNVTGEGFESGNKKSGTYEFQFNSSGTFDYVCTLHPGMKGSVKVS